MKLLDKGLKYNLHYKHKDWIKALAIEADYSYKQNASKRSNVYETNCSKYPKTY
jgi:hypothetical protein